MKNLKSLTAKIMLLLTALLIITSSTINAQNENRDLKNKHIYAVQNLINAITSENEGLKKSGIYLAGVYEIEEVKDALIDQLDKEENPQIRILIALSLYKIGGAYTENVLKALTVNDNNAKVRRISDAIYNELSGSYK